MGTREWGVPYCYSDYNVPPTLPHTPPNVHAPDMSVVVNFVAEAHVQAGVTLSAARPQREESYAPHLSDTGQSPTGESPELRRHSPEPGPSHVAGPVTFEAVDVTKGSLPR